MTQKRNVYSKISLKFDTKRKTISIRIGIGFVKDRLLVGFR